MVRPGDLKGEARGCELNESQAQVASVGIVILGLDVADGAVIVLKLALNDKIRLPGVPTDQSNRRWDPQANGGFTHESSFRIWLANCLFLGPFRA
jgi:hypothetical protein